MAATLKRWAVSFRDARGHVARTNGFSLFDDATVGYLGATGVLNAIVSAFAACTLAHVYDLAHVEKVIYGGTSGGYPDVEDKLVLVFQTLTGSIHRYSVPAPKFTCFQQDGDTANAADTNVASLIAAILANTASRDGVGMSVYLGGYRHRAPMIRRNSVATKNPTLTDTGL